MATPGGPALLLGLVVTLSRWIGFAGLAGLIGSLAVALLVLPAGAPELRGGFERLRRLQLLCIAVLIATSLVEVVERGRTMTGAGLTTVLGSVPVILGRTHFGQVWLLRLGLLGAALAWAWSRSRVMRVALVPLALGAAFTTAATGHAGDRGDASLLAVIDWVHVTSSGAWVGGLLALAAVAARVRDPWPPGLLATVASRFSRLAGWSLLAVVLTGLYNTWSQVPAIDALWTTTYGRILSAKVTVVLAIVCLGAICRYAIVARLIPGGDRRLGARLVRFGRLSLSRPRRPPRAALGPRLFRQVSWEAALGIVVLGCTALLVDSTPARHAGHSALTIPASRGPARVTMEELHGLGGVPRHWVLTPPAGDARHGREVFRGLGCFACHRVAGEDFPPPAAPGPDLTNVGAHHPPAYLLESILNPDAVIVDGPGYTDARGRSTMPDFTRRLSVTDLVDLVAYLQDLSDSPRDSARSSK